MTVAQYRTQAFRVSLTTVTAIVAIAGGALAGLLYGLLVVRLLPAALIGTAFGAALPLAWLWRRAGDRALALALAAWGAARGLQYVERPRIPTETRLLQTGRNRRNRRGVVGELAGCDGGICHHTYTVGTDKARRDYPFTVFWGAVSLPGVSRIAVRRRATAGLLERAEALVSPDRPVELESVEFAERYQVWVADDADDHAVRRLFTPAFIVACLDQDDLLFELERGTLVVAIAGHAVEEAVLDRLVSRAASVVSACSAAFDRSGSAHRDWRAGSARVPD